MFEVTQEKKGTFLYKLTTTVIVSLTLTNVTLQQQPTGAGAGGAGQAGQGGGASVDLSGSMTKQDERRLAVDDKESTHTGNLGVMLEEMELRVRNAIEGIYIQKTREVVNGMRSTSGARERAWEQLTNSLNQAVQKRHE